MKTIFLIIILIIIMMKENECQWYNKTVVAGNFYDDYWNVPEFLGFLYSTPLKRGVVMEADDVAYLFPPTDEKGHLCSVSWNKLFGSSRCGFAQDHHLDSDRFAWRRHPDCLIFNGSYVIGEVPHCKYANQVQICSYSYDAGNKPFQNASLLTIFDTLLTVNTPYLMTIDYY